MTINRLFILAGIIFICSCSHEQINYSSVPPSPSIAPAQTQVESLKKYLVKDEDDVSIIAFLATNTQEKIAIEDIRTNEVVESNTIVSLQTNLATASYQISNVVSDDIKKTEDLTNAVATIKHDNIALDSDSKIISGIVFLVALIVTGYSVYLLRGVVSTGLMGIIILAASTAIIFAATSALTLEVLHLFGAPFPPIFGK